MPFHILNGDALKSQFPASIEGKLIIARECLVDGEVNSQSLEEFFLLREKYLRETYPSISIDYKTEVQTEFQKITALPSDAQVCLWFERDLFCQVNLWFVIHLLKNYTELSQMSLVLPDDSLQYGFGGMSTSALENAYKHRIEITEEEQWAFVDLWKNYHEGNHQDLLGLAKGLFAKFPFLESCLQANADRFPANGDLGRPEKVVRGIIDQMKEPSFGKVFQHFTKEEAIYGFGDLQLKRIYDKLMSE